MREKVAVHGGYVWSYLPDLSRRWGEMEAYPTMIWMQPPGTGTMGHLYLDAYHATGDAYYYEAAREVASGLIGAQHPAGGWNYLYDFAGVPSTQNWYDTIGKNGWRLEEFHHYYGNATFDDAGTSEASQFLLRLYLEKRDPQVRAALDKALAFVLDSQYPNGGWPQRFPLAKDGGLHGRPDYTGYITFNDDVAGENIKFLLMVYQTLGDARALAAIRKAMDIFVVTQQPQPQPAWGLQHKVTDLKPVGARTYEPDACTTHTTANNISQLLNFYEWTGEARYIARVGEALDWLDFVRVTPELSAANKGATHPTFLQIGTNKPLYVHRTGSNVVNGRYYVDEDPRNTVIHYGSFRKLDTAPLRTRYAALKAASPAKLAAASPLRAQRGFKLPRYFTTQNLEVSDLTSNVGDGAVKRPTPAEAAALVGRINAEGYWPTPLSAMSHPYIGDGSPTPAPGDFSRTRVGDMTDTSPYIDENPVMGISTGAYIQHMSALILALGA
jgi:PelA/Pel-15E family pectate lyase